MYVSMHTAAQEKLAQYIIPVTDRCQAVGLAGCGHSKIARMLFVLYVLGPAD